jgi:hypothetical protein
MDENEGSTPSGTSLTACSISGIMHRFPKPENVGSTPIRSSGPVVQQDRTPRCERGDLGFKSPRGFHSAIVQSVERIIGNDEVASSILAGRFWQRSVKRRNTGIALMLKSAHCAEREVLNEYGCTLNALPNHRTG